ncbi:MAG: helix-turn-helix domain-containing protein [Candidatus Woesearchaeota archaeon]
MNVESVLENIGLTKNEIKIYLVLIELGTTTTGAIIKNTGIHTSKVYDGLERLSTKGLVTHIVQSNIKHFNAVPPERILHLLEEKRKDIDSQEQEIISIIPVLKARALIAENLTRAEIFQGWRGLDTVYSMLRGTLKKGEYNYIIGASKGEDPERVKLFFNKHLKQMSEIKIKQKIIFNEDARGNIEEHYKHPELFEARYLKNVTPAEINIWKDNVMIIILRKIPTAILIKDDKVAYSFKQYFETIWRTAKK